MKRLRVFTHFLLCLAGASAGQAQHQEASSSPRRVPATVVLVDSIAQRGAEFVILRRVGVSPHDVIVLRTGASAAHLSEAVRALLMVRQVNGDRAAAAAMMRVRPHDSRGQRQGGALPILPWAPRVIADLRRAGPRNVNGVGSVRAVQIWLPRQDPRSPR